MDISQIVQKHLEDLANYEATKERLEKKVTQINLQLKQLIYPHWTDMLSEVIKKVNEAISSRGYAFKTDGYLTFGFDPSISVFQDNSCSTKLANCCLKFVFRDGLYAYDNTQLVQIYSVNDIISLIDKKRQQHDDYLQKSIQVYGGISNYKEAFIQGKVDFLCLPESEMTEDMLLHWLSQDAYCLRYIPAGMVTYRIMESLFTTYGDTTINVPAILMELLESKMICNLIDKKLITLATENGINLFPYLNSKQMAVLSEIEPETLRKGIRRNLDILYYVPSHAMKEEYLLDLVKFNEWELTFLKWEKLQGLARISQSTAELLFDNEPNAFTVLPDKFKTLAMCHQAVKKSKEYLSYVPSKFLTPKGNLKRLPK